MNYNASLPKYRKDLRKVLKQNCLLLIMELLVIMENSSAIFIL